MVSCYRNKQTHLFLTWLEFDCISTTCWILLYWATWSILERSHLLWLTLKIHLVIICARYPGTHQWSLQSCTTPSVPQHTGSPSLARVFCVPTSHNLHHTSSRVRERNTTCLVQAIYVVRVYVRPREPYPQPYWRLTTRADADGILQQQFLIRPTDGVELLSLTFGFCNKVLCLSSLNR